MSKKVKEHELRLKELENEQEARELRLKEIEHEKEQGDKRREQDDKQREHELKLKEMEMTLELKKLEMNQNVKSEGSNSGHDRSPRAPAFRFNTFNDRTDDLDSWFNTFESQCDIFQVPDIDRKLTL